MIKSNSSSPDRVEELKPCPFCGSAAEMNYDGGSSAWVSCPNRECFVQPEGSTCTRKSGAASVWNTRPESESVTVMREALEKIEAPRVASDLNDYWSGLAIEYRNIAREALARIGGVSG